MDREGNVARFKQLEDPEPFLVVRRTSPEPVYTQFNIVLNWFEELERHAPAAR